MLSKKKLMDVLADPYSCYSERVERLGSTGIEPKQFGRGYIRFGDTVSRSQLLMLLRLARILGYSCSLVTSVSSTNTDTLELSILLRGKGDFKQLAEKFEKELCTCVNAVCDYAMESKDCECVMNKFLDLLTFSCLPSFQRSSDGRKWIIACLDFPTEAFAAMTRKQTIVCDKLRNVGLQSGKTGFYDLEDVVSYAPSFRCFFIGPFLFERKSWIERVFVCDLLKAQLILR